MTFSGHKSPHALALSLYKKAKPEQYRATRMAWLNNNRTKVRLQQNTWRANHKSVRAKYVTNRRRSDLGFRLRANLRCRIYHALRHQKKPGSTPALIGCTIPEFKAHIASLFVPGLSWGNYGRLAGQWSIDHIKPCCMFDLTDERQMGQCFHYTNMQPLWHVDNMKKHATFQP